MLSIVSTLLAFYARALPQAVSPTLNMNAAPPQVMSAAVPPSTPPTFSPVQISTQTYGSIDGQDTFVQFNCEGDAYVHTITAAVTDAINGIQFDCSAGIGSPYYGVFDMRTLNESSSTGQFSAHNQAVRLHIASFVGFSNMEFKTSDTQLVSLTSLVNGAQLQLVPDKPVVGTTSGVWPTKDDQPDAQKPILVTGFDVWYYQLGIRAIRPRFRIADTQLNIVAPITVKSHDNLVENSGDSYLSQVSFGSGSGSEAQFICPQSAWITSIEAGISNGIQSLKFKCSHTIGESPRFGYQADAPNQQSDFKQSYFSQSMSNNAGFSTLAGQAGDILISLRSDDGNVQLTPSQAIAGGTLSSFPSAQDRQDLSREVLITGFDVVANATYITKLTPRFRYRNQTSE